MPELVVDSSIWIDFFNKKPSLQTAHLKRLLIERTTTSPVIISPLIMQEVLQGIDNDFFLTKLKKILKDWIFFFMKRMSLQLNLQPYIDI